MLEEQGEVVALDGEGAWVQTIRQSACDACKLKAGCGQSALAKLTDGKSHRVLVKNSLHAKVGDTVTLSVAEEGLMKASFLVYLLPLFSLIIFALSADMLFTVSDVFVSIAGLAGLGVGFVLVRWISQRWQFDDRFNPKMVDRRIV